MLPATLVEITLMNKLSEKIMSYRRTHLLAAFVVLAFATAMLTVSVAQAATSNIFVPGTTNLYNVTTDWPSGGGTDAVVVPIPLAPSQAISITATGCAVDGGSACTGPDGGSWNFRGLPVYSLIGRWSTSSTTLDDSTAVGPSFFVGSSASLSAPSGTGTYYLFLGDNDGVFGDNGAGYNVTAATDEDGDGVFDDADECPAVAGSLNGCPSKFEVLDASGVKGAGMSEAPGLQERFNPKGKGEQNAGKKK